MILKNFRGKKRNVKYVFQLTKPPSILLIILINLYNVQLEIIIEMQK